MQFNTIIQGDCLEVMPQIADKSIDMILCDLPYGTTACSWDTIIPFVPLWKQYKRIIKDNGVIILMGNEPFSSFLRLSNILWYRYDWKWDKVVGSNFINAKKMPLKVYEDILIFYKNLPIYNPQMTMRDKSKMRPQTKESFNPITNNVSPAHSTKKINKYPTNKIEINRLNNELNSKYVLHPTQKPIALFEYLIKTYTNEGDLVLDNCIGSGTTAIACINLKRNFIGIELDKKYCEIVRKRILEVPPRLF